MSVCIVETPLEFMVASLTRVVRCGLSQRRVRVALARPHLIGTRGTCRADGSHGAAGSRGTDLADRAAGGRKDHKEPRGRKDRRVNRDPQGLRGRKDPRDQKVQRAQTVFLAGSGYRSIGGCQPSDRPSAHTLSVPSGKNLQEADGLGRRRIKWR